MEQKSYNEDTEATRAGRDRAICGRLVNPPLARTTTVLASNLAEWEQTCREPVTGDPSRYYGRFGTATTQALEQAMVQLEGGHRAMLFPSGLAACTHSLMAFARPGDHVLIADSVYGPIRQFANETLLPFGIDVSFYDPGLGAGIEALVRTNTRVIYLESPGSMSFEMQDVPAICAVAKRHGITTLIDNTWATPLYFKPLAHGVDVSIHSATKYICGHSDTLLGIATCTRESWDALVSSASNFGETASPDAAYVALRGLRTLPTRLRRHYAFGLRVAEWLARQP
jgi:cystathionine beta-lyase